MNNFQKNKLDFLLKKYIENPDCSETNFNIAVFYNEIGQTASAISYYLRAAERATEDLLKYESLIKASICFDSQGCRNLSVESMLKHCVALMPKRPEGYFYLSRFYERSFRWFDCYLIASIGEKVSCKKPEELRTKLDYPGFYGIIFEKAVSSWHTGLCEESRDYFKYLLKNEPLDEIHKNSVIYNLKKLNAWENQNDFHLFYKNKEDEMQKSNEIPNFDWGTLDQEYVELFKNENFIHRTYEKHQEVKTNDIVFDIGANYGSFTYSILDKKPKQVYCIEPSNNVINYLRKNVSHGPVIFINKAISDKEETKFIPENGVYIYEHDGDLYSTTTFEKIVKDYNISKIDFLKFDCEGGEYSIFTKGNYNFIRNNVKNFAGEWHINDHENSVERFIEFRNLYLKDCSEMYVYERNGKDISLDIFNDQYLYDFRDWWKNTYLGQFMIYFSYNPKSKVEFKILNI